MDLQVSGTMPVTEPVSGNRTALKDHILSRIPDGGNINSCCFCGACASGCPASGLADMDPRKFVRLISIGRDREVMTNNWVWICTTCNRCVHVCPMQIDIPQMVFIVRNLWPEERIPEGITRLCRTALETDTCSSLGMDAEDWRFVVDDVADEVRQTQPGFEEMTVQIDRKGAGFFLNQHSRMALEEPLEMPALWKILHLAGADWTYGARGWASENYCMFLSDLPNWKRVVAYKAEIVEALGAKVLLNTECGHDFYAVKQGLATFNIPHSFEVRSIIEYYADWIRTGRLKVTSDWNLDLKVRFTVQDPCQLVRKSYGDFIADELRFVVRQCVGEENFVDMVPNRSNNYCCGGGGGAIETDFTEERRQYGRIKLDQIRETGATYCITPCNNCHSQIRDLNRYYNGGFHTIHLWTVLCLAMGNLGPRERRYLGPELKGVGL